MEKGLPERDEGNRGVNKRRPIGMCDLRNTEEDEESSLRIVGGATTNE